MKNDPKPEQKPEQKPDFLMTEDDCELGLDLMGAMATRGDLEDVAKNLPDDSETKAYINSFLGDRGIFPSQKKYHE